MLKKGCAVEGCDGARYAKGYCSAHYQRLKKTGQLELRPREPESLIGRRFGKLTVVDWAPKTPSGEARFRCIGDCGHERIVHAGNLKSGHTAGCQKCRATKDVNLLTPNMDRHIRIKRGGERWLLHRLIAEVALGKGLPDKAVVHHVYGHPDHFSLVVCPDSAYHNLIHARERALDECGNPNFRKCTYCGCYDDTVSMYHRPDRADLSSGYWHKGCFRMAARIYNWKSGKSKPFGAAGLWFELLNPSGNEKLLSDLREGRR
jgi:hypothetical protein